MYQSAIKQLIWKCKCTHLIEHRRHGSQNLKTSSRSPAQSPQRIYLSDEEKQTLLLSRKKQNVRLIEFRKWNTAYPQGLNSYLTSYFVFSSRNDLHSFLLRSFFLLFYFSLHSFCLSSSLFNSFCAHKHPWDWSHLTPANPPPFLQKRIHWIRKKRTKVILYFPFPIPGRQGLLARSSARRKFQNNLISFAGERLF